MVCKGICHRYIVRLDPSKGRYQSGQKRCQVCSLYLIWSGIRCPCCGTRLRNKARRPLAARKIKAKKEKAMRHPNGIKGKGIGGWTSHTTTHSAKIHYFTDSDIRSICGIVYLSTRAVRKYHKLFVDPKNYLPSKTCLNCLKVLEFNK